MAQGQPHLAPALKLPAKPSQACQVPREPRWPPDVHSPTFIPKYPQRPSPQHSHFDAPILFRAARQLTEFRFGPVKTSGRDPGHFSALKLVLDK